MVFDMRKILILTFLILSGCNDSSYSYDDDSFINYVEDNPMMEGAVWLEQSQFSDNATFDKTILVYGYYDDMKNCQTIKKAMQEAELRLIYRCNPVK